jgi:hypothetical protein
VIPSGKFHLYFLIMLWLLIHIFLFWYPGIRDQLFDSQVYIQLADTLRANGKIETSHIFYTIPILAIAFFRSVFGDGIIALVIFQSILSLVASLALYKASSKLFDDSASGFLSAVIFLCWWDVIHWNTAVMTESVFGSLVCFIIFRITHFRKSLRDYGSLAMLLAACIFTRPTGIVIVLGAIVFLLTLHWADLQRKPVLKFVSLTLLLITAYSAAVFMFSQWDFTEQYEKGNLVTYMNTIEGQPFYDENLRMDTANLSVRRDKASMEKIFYFMFDNPGYFFRSAGLKVAYLVSGVRPYFSFVHNFYSAFWLSLIYLFFYFGIRLPVARPVKYFAVCVMLVNCGLIAISTIDWDNRFYLPMQPAIALLAGGGCAFLLRLTGLRSLA